MIVSDSLKKWDDVSDFAKVPDVFVTTGCAKGGHHVNNEPGHFTDVQSAVFGLLLD